MPPNTPPLLYWVDRLAPPGVPPPPAPQAAPGSTTLHLPPPGVPPPPAPKAAPLSTTVHLPAAVVGCPQCPLTNPEAKGAIIESAPFQKCQLLLVVSSPKSPLAEVVRPAAFLALSIVAEVKSCVPVV